MFRLIWSLIDEVKHALELQEWNGGSNELKEWRRRLTTLERVLYEVSAGAFEGINNLEKMPR